MTYKCKICGGQATIDSNNGIVVCNYCGTKQALPLFNAESERLLYDRGNNYLLHSEYDKAENVFNQLLTIKPDASELYWNLVLCKYGVTYVKDPKTGKYIPTCNRTHYTPIFSDENYKKAIELSSGEKKALFEEDAKTIDNIQKGIIAVSKKEKPFDIFISYKETDANGNRTKDSIEAQKLYEKLIEAGYKVFFSRITLEDKIGTEYEPYIYAALYSSKIMLTICSSNENIEAVWVKNEWSRFLGFRQNDNVKTLLPLYFDMDKSDLPEEFALMSAYDIHTDGFEDELLRGIKKLIPLPIMKAKRRKQILKTTGAVIASLAVVVGIASAIIIPQKLEEKRIAEEEAIRASEAAALEKANEDAYQAAMTLFDNADYTAAEAAFIALGDYKDSVHMAARCPIQPDYDAAMQLYYDGKYAQATWAFEALGDYEDAANQKEKSELSWRKSLATIMTASGDNFGLRDYYVTSYGSVADLAGSEVITGPVISISAGSFSAPKILCEDGTISGAQEEKWKNIVQVTPENVIAGTIALGANGKIIMSDVPQWASEYNSLFADMSNWEDIIMLASYYRKDGDAYFLSAYAGVDENGNVHLSIQPFLGEEELSTIRTFMEYPDAFKNVKSIAIDMYDDNYDERYLNAAALTTDGKLVSYINGKISIVDAENVVSVHMAGDTMYKLCSDGKLYSNKSSSAVMQDVVSIFGNFKDNFGKAAYLVTRSGTVYSLAEGTNDFNSMNVKSCIYDEWIAKME